MATTISATQLNNPETPVTLPNTPTPTPVPPPLAPTTNDGSSALTDFLNQSTQNAPTSMEGQYNTDVNNAGISGLQSGVNTANSAVSQEQANLSSIQAQLQGITDSTKVSELKLPSEGISAGAIQGRNLANERNAAIQALPLQASALASQAKIQSLQGNAQAAQTLLTQAQSQVDKLFSIQQSDAQNSFNYKQSLIKAVYDSATKDQQNALDAKSKENDQAFQLQRDKINNDYQTQQTLLANSLKTTGGGGWSNGVNNIDLGNGLNVPADVAPYVSTSTSGINYFDGSTLQGTASEKKSLIDNAQAAGLKVITNKNTVADLTNIADAQSKLTTINQTLQGIAQPNWFSRTAGGIGMTWLETATQSNTQKAAAGALSSVGLDILKAISGVQGFRGNQSAIQQVTDHLPKITDTKAVVNQKITYINNLITARENAILGQVEVISPNGTIGTIPQGQLQDALKQGYKQK